MKTISRQGLIDLALECGADDAGVVSLERAELADERPHVLAAYPKARTLLSLVKKMSRENVRTPARSVANLEFHHTVENVDEAAGEIVRRLEAKGIGAINPSAGFPMEMDNFPSRLWVVSHKPVAEAAGLGRVGIHRSIIHPRFGSFILLGTVILEAEVDEESTPIDFNPCLECKLCVAACPVGALSPDGHFNFSACYTHNYREFMGGFADWSETVAESGSAKALRGKVSDAEQSSMWQSLSFGANYKAAYCLAVCPAGEDVISPYLASKAQHLKDVVDPLKKKVEPVYVVDGSDAQAHVAKRFPHKTPRIVRSTLRPRDAEGFLAGLPLVFQREKARNLDCTYHFTFTGASRKQATVTIRDRKLSIEDGLQGKPHVAVKVDAAAWFAFIYKERGLFSMLATGKLRFRGSPLHLRTFARCFPV